MIIKIDVDGVLRDLITSMCLVYNKIFNENIASNDVTIYDVNKMFPRIKEELNMDATDFFFNLHGKEVFYTLANPCYKAKEAMDMLKKLGHYIIIATYQKTTLNKFDTLYFLNSFNIPYDSICFTEDKEIINCDIMIDDNPSFLDKGNGIKILIDAPYNKEYDKAIRYNSLMDFVKNIDKYDKKDNCVCRYSHSNA